jgi:hypothetical protein
MREDSKVPTRKLNNRKVNEQMLVMINYNNIRNKNVFKTISKYVAFPLRLSDILVLVYKTAARTSQEILRLRYKAQPVNAV